MPGCQKIYLIGFMGSGKTTAGKKLAAILNWTFVDLDKRIEEQTGKTIPQIFSDQGEEYFRNVESELLKNLKLQTNMVISTGGGAPCWQDNMEFMLETGVTIYLKLPPADLKNRLWGSKTGRPLIKNLDEADLLKFIKEKLAVREVIYSHAHITYEGKDVDINSLLSLLHPYLQT